jgi:DNA repair protein RecN (Recombination protein N)
LVDALGLALGSRARSDVVRDGAQRTEVAAGFTLDDAPSAQQWLHENELDDEPNDACILRRCIVRDGRSSAYVNDRMVTTRMLRELGEHLVETHGQHAHHQLLERRKQRIVLDEYANHAKRLDALRRVYERWTERHAELEHEFGPGEDREARLELLRYQSEELQGFAETLDQVDSLEIEWRKLSHLNELKHTCEQLLQDFSPDDDLAAVSKLGSALHSLEDLSRYDPALQTIHENLDSALIMINEGAVELRRYAEHLELDPARAESLEKQLTSLHDLARKHKVPTSELAQLNTRLAEQVAELEGAEDRRAALEAEVATLWQECRTHADGLHKSRLKAAPKLSAAVETAMEQFGLPHSSVEITVSDTTQISATGSDSVEILVSTNPGQAVHPLARVASGGELSRIALAIDLLTNKAEGTPTVIFDEVDAGIGGRVAEIVGQQLRTLAERRQVLCVTHLAQVASQAQAHVRIHKRVEGAQTHARVQVLGEDARVEEIARMLGGLEITGRTRAHAKEMLARTSVAPNAKSTETTGT